MPLKHRTFERSDILLNTTLDRHKQFRQRILNKNRLHQRFDAIPSRDLPAWKRYENVVAYITLEHTDSLKREFAPLIQKFGGRTQFQNAIFQKCTEVATSVLEMIPYEEKDEEVFCKKCDDIIIALYARFEVIWQEFALASRKPELDDNAMSS
jgi:hypothetical protein